MVVNGAFGRRLLLAVDAKGYGQADVLRQSRFQEAIPQLLGRAADAAGLDRERWQVQPGGDSELAVLPEGASEPALVDTFMRSLDAGLRAFNHDRVPEGRLRLRAAVHFGPVSPGPNGFVGPAPVVTGRILDSAVLRAALAENPDACLAVAVSSTVFDDVVREAYTTFRAEEFAEVEVENKEFAGRAWIWVPGGDARAVPGPAEPAAPEPAAPEPDAPAPDAPAPDALAPGGPGDAGPAARPASDAGPAASAPQVVQHFHGTVNAAGAVFGAST
ncbi:hypothetical protein [Streptomyces sp. AV19]|uniref:hypothetical protein n=1 Tax=Streptomyces sp. AV19 TaxID=2793068 RepID=UPI002413B154|nr:hypothetical protein [Streptomyces sp. AV19]MDG4531202.1 hypothetical protein [Streptomyces sp. AV19]